jgi:YVTN family beta-propeller protein
MSNRPWIKGRRPISIAASIFACLLASAVTCLSTNAQSLVYVANQGSNTVSVINESSNTVVATVPVGMAPQGVAVTPNGAYAYVANLGDNTVSVISTSSNTVVATIPAGNQGLFGVAIAPDGKLAYVANDNTAPNNTVSVINTDTNKVTATIQVGSDPWAVAITPNGAFAYVTNAGDDTVSVINTSSGAVVATVPIGSPTGFATATSAAVTPNGKFVYVTDTSHNLVSVISTASNSVVATIPVDTPPAGVPGGAGGGPLTVAVTPDGGYAYATNYNALPTGTVSVISVASNTVAATVRVGNSPYGVSITPDGSFAYVTNLTDGTVSVINTGLAISSPATAVVATISVGGGIGSSPTAVAIGCCQVNPIQTFPQYSNSSIPFVTSVPSESSATPNYFGYCPPGETCPNSFDAPKVWPGGDTIAQCGTQKAGCALTSTATMLTSFSFLQSMTPTLLDSELGDEQPSGYGTGTISGSNPPQTDQCELLFCRVPEIINNAAKAAGRPDVVQLIDGGSKIHVWTDPTCSPSLASTDNIDCYLLTHICQHGDRVILKLNEVATTTTGKKSSSTHYIYVTGESSSGPTDWDVFDPGWSTALTALTLDDHLSGFTTSGGKNRIFTIVEAESYRDLTTFSRSALSSKGNSPVELLITDPEGNRLGNLSSGTDVFEIPLGSYLRDFPVADDTDDDTDDGAANGDPTGIKELYVPAPQAGIYTLTATGTSAGPYSLEFRGIATDGSAQDTELTGSVVAGSIVTYQINYDPTPGVALQVTLIPSTIATGTVVASSLNPSLSGQSVTFTTVVTPASGTGVPTGSVEFFDGTNEIGSGTLNGEAQATFTTSTLSQGSHSITAQYTGNSNFGSSVSTVLTQVVNAAAAPDFTFTASAASISISSPGASSNSVSLTIAAQNGYNGTVAFSSASCSISPAGSESSCAFSPSSVIGSGTTKVTIITTAPQVAVLKPQMFDIVSGRQVVTWTLMLVALLLAIGARPRRRKFVLALATFSALALFNSCSGKGNNGGQGANNSGTPTNVTYTVTVTATANGGQPTHTASFAFSVE